ncbi:MAG: chitobiase/beta-hexosaminidase C-terminal domain-containing protein [Chloroflexota bacterium]
MMNLDRNNQGKYIFGPLFIAVFIIFFSTYSTQISPQFSKSAHAAPQAAPQAGPLAAPQAAPQACGGLVQEGEAATLFGQFAVGNDGNASGGQYIHTPSGSGTNYNEADLANRAEFCVTVPSAGFYQIQGWIYADSGGHNSFYVMVDGQPSDGYIWHTAQNTSYNSDLVSDPDAGDPVEVALTSGDHLITFVKREEQTRLDKMELVLIQSFEEGEGAVINEFMASNSNTLNDEDGDSSDWIELRNPSPLVVNMDGWYLTDDPTDLTKWTFPSTQIAGNDYFIVFASNKNRAQPGAELHTNFKLSSGGDYLALVKPDGVTIVSEFAPTYPEQYSDISFGPDANDSLVYFSPATPGAVNGSGVQIAFLAPPTANVQRGFYTSAQSIALTTSPGTTIRYTTDATDPTSSHGTVYSGPITVDQTTTLRFMAYDGNGNESTIDTHTYIFVADVLTQPTMYQSVINQYADQVDDALLDIPTISLVTPHEIPGHRENEIIPVQTSVELIFPDGKPGFQVGAGVKKYGWASLNRPKNNMRLSFDQEYGVSNLRWPLFADWGQGTLTPAEEFDTIDLRAGGHGDQFLGGTSTSTATQNVTYIARRFIADTRLDMGGLNPHGFFVHVYINGVYWGQYNMGERVDADFYAEYGTGDDADYEAVKSTNTQDGNTWSVADGTGAMWQDIVDNRSNYDYVKDRLDVADHIDYWLTKTFVWFEVQTADHLINDCSLLPSITDSDLMNQTEKMRAWLNQLPDI